VLGLGDQVQTTTPQASFNFDYQNGSANLDDASGGSNDTLSVTHSGGDTVKASQVTFSVVGAKNGDNAQTNNLELLDNKWSDLTSETDISSGMSVELTSSSTWWKNIDGSDANDENNVNLASATVRVNWQSQNGDQSATLGKWDGPNA
jgi:hypothetical protein